MRLTICAALALGSWTCAHSAHAESALRPVHAVYVETARKAGFGSKRLLEPANSMFPGDRVILVLDWRSPAKPGGFVLTSPVPKPLSFERSSNEVEEISVDGGRHWGRLGSLKIRDANGLRFATPEDATHVRWRIPARIAAQGAGRIAYSAIVR